MFCVLAGVNEDEDEGWEKQKGGNGMEAHGTINGNQRLYRQVDIATFKPPAKGLSVEPLILPT